MMISDPCILYVEDDPDSRRVMRLLLTADMQLSNVVIFPDSHDFEAKIEVLDPKPHIIFLDIHVKPLSGFEMLRILRNHPDYAHVAIIALTASVMNEEVKQLRHAGFDGCLAKPIAIEQFPLTLDAILRGEKVWRIMA